MNITDLTKTLTTQLSSNASSTSSNATSAADRNQDAVSKALTAANDRLDKQRKASEVQLSAFGQIKSSVADLQSSSKALSEVKNTDSVSEAKKIAQNFVNAANKARDTAAKATDNNTNGALAGNGRAQVANNEINRTLNNNTNNSSLQQLGITQNKNGTLTLDTAKFEQAFKANPTQAAATLAEAGKQVETDTSKQLNNNSNVNRSINTLSTQVKQLEDQQTNQQNLADTLQRATEDASNRLNATNAAGIAAYQKIFSL